ncbi:hypothetical protein K8T06_10315, partial [bacterium]|nr:hypothetical protein [bacterium]
MENQKFRVVNKSIRKTDAIGLATGKRTFTDDIKLHGMLVALVLRSPHAHARILSIDTTKAE